MGQSDTGKLKSSRLQRNISFLWHVAFERLIENPKIQQTCLKYLNFQGGEKRRGIQTCGFNQFSSKLKAKKSDIKTNLITLAIRHPPTSVVWLDTGSQASSILIKPGTRCFVCGYVAKCSIARQRPTLIEFEREREGRGLWLHSWDKAPCDFLRNTIIPTIPLPKEMSQFTTFETFAPLQLNVSITVFFSSSQITQEFHESTTQWFPGWVLGILGVQDHSFPDRSTRPNQLRPCSNAKELSADFSPGDTSSDWRF